MDRNWQTLRLKFNLLHITSHHTKTKRTQTKAMRSENLIEYSIKIRVETIISRK